MLLQILFFRFESLILKHILIFNYKCHLTKMFEQLFVRNSLCRYYSSELFFTSKSPIAFCAKNMCIMLLCKTSSISHLKIKVLLKNSEKVKMLALSNEANKHQDMMITHPICRQMMLFNLCSF